MNNLSTVPMLISDANLEPHATFLTGPTGLEEIAADREVHTMSLSAESFDNFVAWHRSYLGALASHPERNGFCVLAEGGETRAIVPLEIIERRWAGIPLQVVALPNHPVMPTGDYWLVDSSAIEWAAASFLKALQETRSLAWHALELPNITAHDRFAKALMSQAGFAHLEARTDHVDYLPIIPYEKRFKQFSGNFRSNLRRARKALAKLGEIEYRSAIEPAELREAFEIFVELEASGWKGQQKTSIRDFPGFYEFFSSLVENFGELGRCEIQLLLLEGKPLAGELLLQSGTTLYQVKLAYDEEHSRAAPGNMLMEHLLRQCDERDDIDTLDLVSGTPWHAKWQPKSYDVFEYCLYRRTMFGKLARLHKRTQAAKHRFLFEHVRPLYRRLRGKPVKQW